MIYHALFERADDGSVFAYVPDLPGCTSWAPTLEEAKRSVGEAARLWIEVARERGDAVPAPSTIAAFPIDVITAA